VLCHNDGSVVADNGTGTDFGANNSISFRLSAINSASSVLSAAVGAEDGSASGSQLITG
jgi:hypothetical protein